MNIQALLCTILLTVSPLSIASDTSQLAGPFPSVSLSATVTEEVPNDEMVVVLFAEHKGLAADKVGRQVLAELNAALDKAKLAGETEYRLGSVHTTRAWGQNGVPAGWQVRGEVVLTSRNLQRLGELAGELSAQLQIQDVRFQLSKERDEAIRSGLMNRAAQSFRAKAASVAQAFGYQDYQLQSLGVDQSAAGVHPARPMMMHAKMASAGTVSETIPAEGGKAMVTVTINGTVLLLP